MSAAGRWAFWIDRGGTFTDAIGLAPDGTLHVAKRLSSDEASAAAIRSILARAGQGALPALSVRAGTTVATNALLERRGAPCVLVTNRGLGDLLEIGTQERPELFALAIRKPEPLHARAIEVAGRSAADGSLLEALDEGEARARLAAARAAGLRSAAIVWMHAYADPAPEARLAALAREAGFEYVAASAEVARELGLLARGETTVADAYLTPLLRDHVAALAAALPGARLRFMQSTGGLTDAERFRGPVALLSGPAGGAVGAAHVAREEGFASAIGFDMGGTSTDVTLLQGGEAERAGETVVAGVRVCAPMLSVHTIAAGGGSLCRFDGVRLTVGPESAGARPGPLCYGLRDTSGARLAGELALTDADAFLGRLPPDRFPLPLELAPVAEALARMARELAAAGHDYSPESLAAGFVEIANESMAEAIGEVSVQRGVDPREFALVGFGGAAGQHAAAVARRLGIRTVLLHPLAGVLSAYGIGVAELAFDAGADAGRVPLERGGAPEAASALLARLEAEGRAALAAEGADPDRVRAERVLDLRYVGSDAALSVPAPPGSDLGAAFAAAHRARYGYERPGRGGRGGGGAGPRPRARGRAGAAAPAAARPRGEPAGPAPRAGVLRRHRLVRGAGLLARGPRARGRARRPRARARGDRNRRDRAGLSRAPLAAGHAGAPRPRVARARAGRARCGRSRAPRPRGQPLHVDRRAHGHRAPPHRGVDEHQGPARLLVRRVRRRGRARRQRAAHPGAPRRDGRDGASAPRGIPRIAPGDVLVTTIRSRAARTCRTSRW